MSQDDFSGEKDFYLNEKGLLTFTETYLLNRGYCCGCGCRHCPYDYKNVPEPKRQFLLEERSKRGNGPETNS